MNRKKAWITLLICMLCVCGSANDRVWTDKNGSQIKASVFAAYGPTVFFDAGRGRYVDFPISLLIDSDQKLIIKWAAEHEEERMQRGKVADSDSKLTQFLKDNLYRINDDKLVEYEFGREREPEFYGFYFSAYWCAPCQKYTPRLVAYYDLAKKLGYENFEFIFVSWDRDKREMIKYMKEKKMNWPAIHFSKRNNSKLLKLEGSGIPCLVVTNKYGQILYHSYNGDKYLGPNSVKKKLQVLLKYSNLEHLKQVDQEASNGESAKL